MSHPKGLEWTEKQVAVYNYIQSNPKAGFNQIKTQLGISADVVSKVIKAMKQGGVPTPPKPPKPPPSLSPPPPEELSPASKKTVGQAANKPTTAALDAATLARLFSPAVSMPITPIMSNARVCAIRELGWRPDMPWENFFDTCLVHLFKLWGFVLQGYIVVDEVEKKDDDPSVVARGNGKKKSAEFLASLPEEVQQLAAAIAVHLVNTQQAAPQATSDNAI